MVELVLNDHGRTECSDCGHQLHEHARTRVYDDSGRWHWKYHCKESYT